MNNSVSIDVIVVTLCYTTTRFNPNTSADGLEINEIQNQ
jgi:hypothetical protein